MNVQPITQAFLGGLLQGISPRVDLVNAMNIAEQRGILVAVSFSESQKETIADIVTKVVGKAGEQEISGKVCEGGEGRVTQIVSCQIEFVRRGHMLCAWSEDRTGLIGKIGSILGENNANIASISLGRDEIKCEAF